MTIIKKKFKKSRFFATTYIFVNFYSYNFFFIYFTLNEGGYTFVFHRKIFFHIPEFHIFVTMNFVVVTTRKIWISCRIVVILEKPVTSKLLNFFIRFLHLISYLVANFYGISYLNIEIPFLGQTISPSFPYHVHKIKYVFPIYIL